MHEGVRRVRAHRVGAFESWQSKRHRLALARRTQSSPNFRISLRRAESHDDVVRTYDRFQPRPEVNGKIQGGKRALAHDYGMNELDRDVLRVSCIRSPAKREKPATAQKSFGHFAGRFRQSIRFARKEGFEGMISRQQALGD